MYACKYCAFIIIESRIFNHRTRTHRDRQICFAKTYFPSTKSLFHCSILYAVLYVLLCVCKYTNICLIKLQCKIFLTLARSLARAHVLLRNVSRLFFEALVNIATCFSNIFLSNFIRWKTFLFYIRALCACGRASCVQCFCNGKMMKWYFTMCLLCQTVESQ